MKTKILFFATCVIAFFTGYMIKPDTNYNSAENSSLAISNTNTLVSSKSTETGVENLDPSPFSSPAVLSLAKEYPYLFKNHLNVNRILAGMAFDLLETNPGAAVKLLNRFTDDNTRLGVQESVISVWAEKHPKEAIKWLELKKASNPEEYEGYYLYALNSLARQFPEEAMHVFRTIEPGQAARSAIIQGVATGWGKTDPEAGFDWLIKLKDEPDLDPTLINDAYKDLMLGYMNLDRDSAATAITELESTQLKVELVRPLVLKYADAGFQDAVNFINTLDNAAARKAAAAHFVEVLGPQYPSEIINFAIKNLDLNTGRQVFLRQAFISLSLTDSTLALREYHRLEGSAKAAAMEAIAYTMSQVQGREAVVDWVSKLPTIADRNNGYAALATNNSHDPLTLFESLSHIQNVKIKAAALESVVSQVSPNQLFDIHKLLQTGKLNDTDTTNATDIIRSRIRDEYGDLVFPL